MSGPETRRGLVVAVPAPWLTVALVAGHIYYGYGYVARDIPWSRTYTIAFQWFPPMWWGWAFLAGAGFTLLALWLPRVLAVAAHLVAAAPLFAFTVALFGAEVNNLSQGWGGPALFGIPAVLHLLLGRARYGVVTR